MGSWAFTITGVGGHDNGDAKDADAIFASAVAELRAAGHSIGSAWFASANGSKDGLAIPPASPVSSTTEEPPAPAPVADAVEPAPPAAVEPAPTDSGAGDTAPLEDTQMPAGTTDYTKPFKCPSCGATYDEQVECANGHPAVETLPTADVLAGAADPLDAPETSQPSSPASEPELPPVGGGDATSTTGESSGSSGSAIVSSEPGAEQQVDFPGQ